MMRYSKMKGLPLKATDGEIGKIEGALIDLDTWRLRYLLVQTGSWLNDRKVMIAPEHVIGDNHEQTNIAVDLDREKVEHAPELNPDVPIQRDAEQALREHYSLPMYWTQHGDPIQPHHQPDAVLDKVQDNGVVSRKGSALASPGTDVELYDMDNLIGFSVESSDTDVGRLDDIIIDESSWRIDRFVVNLSNYMPSKLVLVNRDWLEDVRWAEEVVQLEATTSAVKGSPITARLTHSSFTLKSSISLNAKTEQLTRSSG